MKKLFALTILLIGFQTLSFAQKQKVTLDEDTIKVNGISYAILDKSAGLGFDFKVKSLDGKDLFFLKFLDFNNPSRITSGNPKGRVTYFEATFFNDGKKCEVDATGGKKSVAKMIVENDLIKDNAVNESAENTFVLINGMKFSEERNNMNNGNVIIIQR